MNGLILVETRDIKFDPIKRHLPFLDGFEVMVFCSEDNSYLFREYETINVSIKSLTEYNQLLASYDFWKQFDYEKVLICQHDSGLLRDGIEDFYEWDYVGAPWWFQDWGGNGGLSLRTVKAMQDITINNNWTGFNEDIFFTHVMHYSNMYKLAPRNICKQFSVESIFKLETLGYHSIERYFNTGEVEQILHQYGRASHSNILEL